MPRRRRRPQAVLDPTRRLGARPGRAACAAAPAPAEDSPTLALVRTRVLTRIAELEPLVRELEQLHEVLATLDRMRDG